MLELAESMLNANGAAPDAAPKRPLKTSLSSANERSSRSSVSSDRSKTGLSGQEQDAVVAKIRSVAKRSASPEKTLPYQDDDTPTTKGARLKKEMEVGFVCAAPVSWCRWFGWLAPGRVMCLF